MAFDQMNIRDMLCDMYDVRNKLKLLKVDGESHRAIHELKDNDGTIFTLGDCCDNVIDQLEQELTNRGEEIV